MAKYEDKLKGNLDEFVEYLERKILEGSISAHLEDSSDYQIDEVRCAVRVFERYSAWGGNRLSMNLTILSKGDDLFLSAITSGGSQAVILKINTIGEEVFLDKLIATVEKYKNSKTEI